MKNKPAIVVGGDAQAEAVAVILRTLPAVADAYDIAYGGQDLTGAPAAHVRFVLAQDGAITPRGPRLPKQCRRVTFPALRLRLLWPLAAPAPEGAFAKAPALIWGDSFISTCVERHVPPEEILRQYEAPVWNTSWPNLDELFTRETGALLQADAKCDVKIGSFVLRHFRTRRLFWAMTAPTNMLLGELTYRLLHACFGRDVPADREAIASALSRIGSSELMARAALPVHPRVAAHFGLEWYDPLERYPGFDGERRTFGEYYRALIEYLREPKV